MKIGAHQSIAGGLHRALQRGTSIGLECVQIFTHAPQSWQAPVLTDTQIAQFHQSRRETGYDQNCIAVHASYLANPCSSTLETREKAIRSLICDAICCDTLRIPYLVFHPGSPGKHDANVGIAAVAEALLNVLNASQNVTLLIENTAGCGKSIGHTFKQIAEIIRLADSHPRIGCCFDTAHAFAAGYDLRLPEFAQGVFDQFDAIVGLDRLKWIHLNDSRTGLGSRVDRHERIGQGRIGAPFFKWFVGAPFAAHLPATLETPLEKNETYQEDVAALRGLNNFNQI